MSRLDGVRAKIDRAKQHIRDMEREVLAFIRDNPARDALVAEFNPETADVTHKVRFVRPIPNVIPLLAGDAVHNLRSALDHLAYQLADANGGRAGKHTHFPVCKDAATYGGSQSQGKIAGIAASAKQVIESVQPYHAGYELLATIHGLDLIDKHRLLLLVARRVTREEIGTMPPANGVAAADGKLFHIDFITAGKSVRLLENGDVFCISLAVDGRQTYPQIDFTFSVAFREPGVIYGEPVCETLAQLTGLVESIVGLFVAHL